MSCRSNGQHSCQHELQRIPRCCPKGPQARERRRRPSRRRRMVKPRPPDTWGRKSLWRLEMGHIQFGPQPNTILETYTAPESGKQPPSKQGGAPIPPVTFVHPEALDTLLEALQSASIVEEHRTLMGMVVERIQSVKSRLTEACTSLLIGFEV